MLRVVLFVACIVTCGHAFSTMDKEFTDGGVKAIYVSNSTWYIVAGDICDIRQLPRPIYNNTAFLECVRFPEYSPDDLVGVWLMQKCIEGTVFSQLDGHCRPERQVRRQVANLCGAQPGACGAPQFQVAQQQPVQACPCQAQPQSTCMCPGPQVFQPQPVVTPPPVAPQACGCQTQSQCPCAPQQPPVVVQPQPCPQAGSPAQAQENGICSWMLDPLAADPTTRNCFLQCQPAPYSVFCGRWRKMPCSIYTIFDVNLQVCVNDPNAVPGPLPPRVPAPAPFVPQPFVPPQPVAQPASCGCSMGTNIGQCGSNYNCPGQSQCQVTQLQPQASACGACCYFGKILHR